MKLVVIVPTHGRRDLVNRSLRHLESQHRAPDEIIVSAPDEGHVAPYHSERTPVMYVFGRHGLAAQRNHALRQALGRFDVITFFDDDFLPAPDYLALLLEAFKENPDFAVVMGNVVADGATSAGLSFDDGLEVLSAAQATRATPARVVDHPGAYGCNMSIRSKCIGDIRFDERLPLYGWQEDIDFTSQLRRYGRIVQLTNLAGVHLGIKNGKVSGLRFGYSQIVNPIYLIRKGTIRFRFGANLIGRNLVANLVRSVSPEAYIDRRGRLKGNCLGIYHVMKGRIEPEHILKL
jgi:GT2 family glycosyltransferase